MENNLEPQDKKTPKLSRLGIGPVFATLSISYFVATVALTMYHPSMFCLLLIPDPVRIGGSAICIVAGLLLYGSGVAAMLQAYKADKLSTSGPFSICRHPIYSAWICFLVPGLAFWANSLLSFTTPMVMYFLFKWLIKKEDRYLEQRFGTEYLLYRQNTPEILPVGWFKRIYT